MSMTDTTSSSASLGYQNTVTAFFDDQTTATRAVEALVAAGVARSHIKMTGGSSSSTTTTSTTSTSSGDKGFWASLGDLFLPDEDRYAYSEGLNRGGVMVAVTAAQGMHERIAEILEEHGAVDMDERESSWRKEGWTGYDATSHHSSTTTSTATGAMGAMGAAATGAAATAAMATGTRAEAGDAEVLRTAEERLRVGKRMVEGGRVRVRTYVVETPVEEQVRLREEHVHVERRPLDQTVTGANADALFTERTIEANTMREEAVVSKEARVTGEVVVNKTADERVETVRDTVRRTEVDVEDGRTVTDVETTRTSTSGTTGAGGTNRR